MGWLYKNWLYSVESSRDSVKGNVFAKSRKDAIEQIKKKIESFPTLIHQTIKVKKVKK